MKPVPAVTSSSRSVHEHDDSLDATTFRLRPSFNQWFWITLARCFTLAALITALVFGATGKVFGVAVKSIFGASVDADTQLAAIGFVNKILDVLVQKSLEESAFVCLTLWMTTQGADGVHLDDFQLKDELTKPWFAIWNFGKRRRLHGWRYGLLPDLGRLLITLATSISVLLLAVAINTLGPPKLRWYPEVSNSPRSILPYASITHPRLTFIGLDWMNFWNEGFAITGGGNPSWAAANGLITASAFTALKYLSALYQRDLKGWLPNNDDITKLTALNTATDGHIIQSLSVQNWIISRMFDQQRANGRGYVRRSIGFTGNLTVTLPTLTTYCSSTNDTKNSGQSFTIDPPTSHNPTAFNLFLSKPANSNMSAMACRLNFTQALYPVTVWIIDNGSADLSVNDYDKHYDYALIPLPSTPLDANITQALSVQLAAVLDSFNRTLLNTSTADLLALIARKLRSLRPQVFTSDETAITPVVAVLAQHLLGIAAWNVTAHGGNNITSRPIQHQVYGAGPRVSWEWATVVVVAIIMATQLYGLFCAVKHRIGPAPWLEVGGMLIAANTAPRMNALGECLSEDEREARLKEGSIFARDIGGVAQITDVRETVGIGGLDRRKRYRYVEDYTKGDWQI